ncbi:MAG: hypothetical protein ACFCVD_05120 [Nodosilinea sp.]
MIFGEKLTPGAGDGVKLSRILSGIAENPPDPPADQAEDSPGRYELTDFKHGLY